MTARLNPCRDHCLFRFRLLAPARSRRGGVSSRAQDLPRLQPISLRLHFDTCRAFWPRSAGVLAGVASSGRTEFSFGSQRLGLGLQSRLRAQDPTFVKGTRALDCETRRTPIRIPTNTTPRPPERFTLQDSQQPGVLAVYSLGLRL